MQNKTKKHKNLPFLYLLLLVVVLAISYVFLKQNAVSDHLLINEVSFMNNDKQDWIEIYNPTMNNLSLEGLYISDDKNEFSKYHIDQEIIIPSHGYVVIYCDGFKGIANNLETNFNISNGETVYLVGKDGSTLIDSLTVLSSDEELENFTIGRFPDGTDVVGVMDPTMNERNQDLVKPEGAYEE